MKFNALRLGQVRPAGWLAQWMTHDWENGFVGHLDELAPDLFADDIYGANRRTSATAAVDVGAVTGKDNDHPAQFQWWNGETQSNWRDGWVRHALLVGGGKGRILAKSWVNRMLATQDDDGYLGIYGPDLRYRHEGENGELWAQTTVFRALLGYYDATRDDRVLEAVVRAVRLTCAAWPLPGSHPFQRAGGFAGVAHGLMFVDVLDILTEETGDPEFRKYAAALYAEYCRSRVSEPDCQSHNLLNPDYRFRGHGVHTWEHLRAVTLAAFYGGDSEARAALVAYLERLDTCLTPSGAPIGDEWIDARVGDAETGYEYCSVVELLASYALLLRLTGEARWADRMEHLVFNAALGARHPSEPSLAYLKTDNCTSLTGVKDPDHPHPDNATQTRYRSSPVHREAAVCCVPNAGRLFPIYLGSLALSDPRGLRLALYGPAVIKTEVNQTPVTIELDTAYPDDLAIEVNVYPDPPAEFSLFVRIPEWAEGCLITGAGMSGLPEPVDGWLEVRRRWNRGDSLRLVFEALVVAHSTAAGSTWFSRGPLVWALPLGERTEVTRTWPFGGFRELKHHPVGSADFRLTPGAQAVWSEGGVEVPLVGPDGAVTVRHLVPLKDTVLRRVTFDEADPQ